MPPKIKQQDSDNTVMLSKEQEEEMNSALIAKLLAQDAMDDSGSYYYAEYNNSSRHYDTYNGNNSDLDDSYAEESDDYAPKRAAKPKKAKAKKTEQAERRGRKRKNAPMDVDVTATVESMDPIVSLTEPDDGNTKTTKPEKPKKVKKPLPPGFKIGIYTDEEEVLFLEGLNLHGRNWNELSRHMGTRDPHSIRSHAQKHFIKLYRDNLPLPDKVKESGEGFTLSGKPLDPDSAAAKPYLNRSAMGTKTTITTSIAPAPTKTKGEVELHSDDAPKCDPMQVDSSSTCDSNAEATNGTEQSTADLDIGGISLKPMKQKSPSAATDKPDTSSTKKAKKHTRQDELPVTAYEDNGRTNYAASRLRRPESRNPVIYESSAITGDRLTMVKCEPFTGKPGSDTLGAQPFEMIVHSNVLLTMDFHSHLMLSEIIGLLAGEWDRTTKRLTVKEAFPCRSLNTGQNEVNVEMDPTSALEIRHLIEEKNMTVVGWYHSHPLFIPDPSLVDIENQLNYQNLCRDECQITSASTPVDTIQDSAVALSLESLQNDDNDNNQKTQVPELTNSKASSTSSASTVSSPMSTVVMEPFVGAIVGPYDPKLPASASVFNWFHVTNTRNEQKMPKQLIYELQEDTVLSLEEEDRLFQLPIAYQTSPEKVNFRDKWRHDSQETKLEKLIKSLAARMPWIQRKLLRLQQEQETTSQQDTMGTLSSTVDDIHISGSELTDDIDVTGHQASPCGDNRLTDAFLEKVQATLKNW